MRSIWRSWGRFSTPLACVAAAPASLLGFSFFNNDKDHNSHERRIVRCECEPYPQPAKTRRDARLSLERHQDDTTTTSTTNSNSNSSNNNDNKEEEYRVLVIGSGLTGCLTALLIRQNWSSSVLRNNKKGLHLEMMERATYPAGRFGAMAYFKGATANLGAQVLSTLNPSDARARGGHGVTTNDIALAHEICSDLTKHKIIEPLLQQETHQEDDNDDWNNDTSDNDKTSSTNERLCPTEERMMWEGLWIHHLAPRGMMEVLYELLRKAKVVPMFGTRIDSVELQQDHGDDPSANSVLVRGVQRGLYTIDENINNDTTTTNEVSTQQNYDCVVICVPAPDALSMLGTATAAVATGVSADHEQDALSSEGRTILHGVGYDSRVAEAHFFHPRLRPHLQKIFGNRLEINVDDEEDGALHLISFQDAQQQQWLRLDQEKDEEESLPCAIVVHGKANMMSIPDGSVAKVLSKLFLRSSSPETTATPTDTDTTEAITTRNMMNEKAINENRLHVKRIHWSISQMIMPMEAVIADPHSRVGSPVQCLEGSGCWKGRLVLAGDYMTQSSFLGCLASASAAAQSVLSAAFEEDLEKNRRIRYVPPTER